MGSNVVSEPSVRRQSSPVGVGSLQIGGGAPLAVQSMTTTNTLEVGSTVRQTASLIEAGCDLVRITAQTSAEAKALGAIKAELLRRRLAAPLAADIHFNPAAALEAAEHVEKVRVNPGNFADSKRSLKREYADAEYEEELSRIGAVFTPLVEKCKRLRRAIRIGTNHGSLSDRIMNRYGDNPQGMVESAVEYVQAARSRGFDQMILSMKASNPVVMLQANRLLVETLDRRGWPHPLHLGVTEAGEGEDARLKSAIGIGVLLAEGIGDTIRVSLTEDPVKEVPVALGLARWAEDRWRAGRSLPPPLSPFAWRRRPTRPALYETLAFGGEEQVKVGLFQGDYPHPRAAGAGGSAATRLSAAAGGRDTPCEFVLGTDPRFEIVQGEELLAAGREAAHRMEAAGDRRPIILVWDARRFLDDDLTFLIEAAVQVGGLLVDGIGDGVVIRSRLPAQRILTLTYNLLQAARIRSVKAEYIACPGCGRTLFDLESTTQRIKAKTGHLKGVKIAVMGCIVNGPGEMADADFGYVGGSPGAVNLYVGKEMVERGIPTAEADERLIALIKAHGKWVDS
ncbi:MAG: (E)-4-hydroxy-3-methylbut-2-enyl-diphosphate synthase [Candidatus Omnitrophica bacterium]|nr:(E)-4-hydroxy-3-methylbut-2-enyl-diphosphate synthase [Candidatus Omnitrophota bacterium]